MTTLSERLPALRDAKPDELLDAFVDHVAQQGLSLYPAQEEALLEIFAGKNVILSTPTGSGKSLVALALCFKALALGCRAVYTAPVKALVNEKFFDLCRELGPDHVGMMTGDATVNRNASVLVCTTEILASMALREGRRADVDYAILDEFHYYADKDRGTAWQVPLLALPRTTFLLMSATMGPTEAFEERLTRLNGRPTVTVRSKLRPVPLEFEYRETPLHETVHDLIARDLAPVYVVAFTQRACAEEAQNLMSVDVCSKENKRAIAEALDGARWNSPYGKEIQRFVRHGIGIHHAGLLPRYRLLVEKLAQRGLLKVICGTDTLGVGVNIPIRTVVLTKLCKYDGDKTAILSARDFHQIAGRAGRKGFDERGWVVVQAPEHVIENLRMEAKAANDPAKKRKLVKRKPPERGYVHWDRTTFERLVRAEPEPLVSRFEVTHGMLLSVLGRPDGCAAMKSLVRSCHDGPRDKRRHARTAVALLRSLVEAGIVELVPRSEETPSGVRVNADLQEDFSIHHALALWLYGTIPALKKDENPEYHLDLLTCVESILEDPDVILARQLDRLKQKRLAELKAAGVDYEERVAELEKMEYPKPNADFIYATFNELARTRPWLHRENIRPKSIAREMLESFMSFGEYVKEYGLERVEGTLLRYLSEVYRALVQTVPDPAKTQEVEEAIVFFRSVVRGVDSSLVDEWEKLRGRHAGGEAEPEDEEDAREAEPWDVTSDERTFTIHVRNDVFALVRALATRSWERAAELLADGARAWSPAEIERAMGPCLAEHAISTAPAARAPQWVRIRRGETAWEVEQVLLDDEGATPYYLDLLVELEPSRAAGRPVLTLRGIGS